MRLTLTDEEFYKIQEALKASGNLELSNMLGVKKYEFSKSITYEKRRATAKANEAKTDKSIKIIKDSLQQMREQELKINVNSVSKFSGLAYNTVKNYKYLLE